MKFDGAEYFTLREEIIYSSIEQITFVKRLQRPIECGFYPSKLIRDLNEKLVETRVWGCLERKKEKYGIYNSESKVPACNNSCHFPASECRM